MVLNKKACVHILLILYITELHQLTATQSGPQSKQSSEATVRSVDFLRLTVWFTLFSVHKNKSNCSLRHAMSVSGARQLAVSMTCHHCVAYSMRP